jgi:hypothetical protein
VAVLFAAEIICIYYFSALGFCFFINIWNEMKGLISLWYHCVGALLRALEFDPAILFYIIIAIYFVVCFFVLYVLYISGLQLLLKYHQSEDQANVFWRRAQRVKGFSL